MGDGAGCGNLGIMYLKGDGVEKNLSKALLFFQKGCQLGSHNNCQRASFLKTLPVANRY
ncbi:MAG: beta-lactamase hcpA [Epsilonproteobacteria bacterium]|nr:beta-lactamase hcpA [Campylobacterota bacterium]NPA89713.1 SEL1-like repeat protein [Campylobacterota bacterium]